MVGNGKILSKKCVGLPEGILAYIQANLDLLEQCPPTRIHGEASFFPKLETFASLGLLAGWRRVRTCFRGHFSAKNFIFFIKKHLKWDFFHLFSKSEWN